MATAIKIIAAMYLMLIAAAVGITYYNWPLV